jgi:transposase-like protein
MLSPCVRIVAASLEYHEIEGQREMMQCKKRYTEEFRKSVVKQMMTPNPVPVSRLVKETGVSDVTLYKWRKDYKNSSDQNGGYLLTKP